MALIKCPNCGRDISDKAKKCPGCGWIPGTQTEKIDISGGTSERESSSPEVNSNNLEQIKKEKEELERKVSELERIKPTVVDNTDYAAIEKQKQTIRDLQADRDELLKRLQKIENAEPKVVDNTDYQLIESLENEIRQLKNGKDELQKQLNNSKQHSTSDNGAIFRQTKKLNYILLFGIGAILFVEIIGIILLNSSLNKSFDKMISGSEETVVDIKADAEAGSDGDFRREESVQEGKEDLPKEQETEGNSADGTDSAPVNDFYDGELRGEASGEVDSLDGIVFTYVGVGENVSSSFSLLFRVTNNSGEDVNIEYKGNAYANGNSVSGSMIGYGNEIPAGRSSILKIHYFKNEFVMSAGEQITDMELTFEKDGTKFPVAFKGMDLNLE